MSGEDILTIETDAAFQDALGGLLADAFPQANIRVEGPLRETLAPAEAVQWALEGTIVTFTVTGGIGPAIDILRGALAYITNGYQAAVGRHANLRPTKISYRGQEVTLDVSTPDGDVALEALKEVLKDKDGR